MFTRLAWWLLGLAFLMASAWPGSSEGGAQTFPAVAQNSNGTPSPSRGRREMISWVVLSNSYVELQVDALRKKLDEVYPGQFLPQTNKNFVVDGPTPGQFLIKSNIAGAAGMFMLLSVSGPYTEFSNIAGAIADPLLLR